MNRDELKKYPYFFILLYGLIFMGNAVYSTFVPVYLDNLGFNNAIVGMLLSLGPFVTILSQPVWGIAGDRASNKNSVLKVLLLGCAVSAVLYPVSGSLVYLLIIISVYTFFQTGVSPLSDTITLEYLDSTHWKYGPIRMAGTIGYALMSVIAGIVAKDNISSIFPLYFLITILAMLVVFRVPKIQGYQSQGAKVAIWKLFENRELMVLMSLNFIAMVTLGFYYSFFGIYYNQVGGNSALLGWGMFISAGSEIPFLLFSDRIVKKLGVKRTLIIATAIMAIRWLLLYLLTDVYVILGINALHGFSFIALSYSMVTYINKNVQKELRTSGQAFNGLVGFGFARIIGGTLGGFLSDIIGIRQVFLYTAIINFTAMAVFGVIFYMQARRKANVQVE